MYELDTVSAQSKPVSVLVVGGGIGGMRAALDLADAGMKVYLIDQAPCLGGRVAQLGYMFPQHDCVLCRGTSDHGYGCTRPSISPAYIQHNLHPNIEIMTSTLVVDTAGQAGDFTVSLRQEPRFVDAKRCINCGYCSQVCPVELPNDYQQGFTNRKAAYKVSARAMPDAYVIDRHQCIPDCRKCEDICPTKAIDLNQQARLLSVGVGAIILALGFQSYDPSESEEYGYGRFPNVLQAMQYERLASRSGPTEGIVVRPSDSQRPRSIAWLQCIGSRDQKHSYCSSICCMYATKEAILAKQRLGDDLECEIFILDERAFNKEYNKYFSKARNQYHIQYNRCRISSLQEDPDSHDVIVNFADPDGHLRQARFGMVVLATGLLPPKGAEQLSRDFHIELNEYGYCKTEKFTPLQTTHPGVFVCGAFSSPKEIVETIIDASGAAAEVMRLLNDRIGSSIYTRQRPFLSVNSLPPEKSIDGQPERTGVFVCSCEHTLDEFLDTKDLANQAKKWSNVVSSEVLDFACTPESLDYVRDKIKTEGLNRIVMAACSNRTHEPLFQRMITEAGLNPYLLEQVNLREQCGRVHQWQRDMAQRKALELIRVAAGRVALAQPVYKQKHRCRPTALVIGGGVAGLTSALAIADSGFNVNLVERSEMLGGNLLNIYYVAEGFNPQRLLRDLVNRVRSHQGIKVFTRSEITRHSGHVGFFQTDIATRQTDGTIEKTSFDHGVTIVATGGQESQDHPWLELPNVITQRKLEELILHQPERVAALKNVVMIQCMHPPGEDNYCSRVCCTSTLKNAIRIKLTNPNCQVSILYKNIVTYGFREEFYTQARKHGVIFIRYTDENPPLVNWVEDHLEVRAFDISLNQWLLLPADIIPLSMSIAPSKGTQELAKMLRVPLSGEGFFSEAQLKLRPMDFMREGIFLAGMAHYPKFIEESISHALAASARAMTLLAWESLYLGGIVAQVDAEKCVGCLTCTRTCPFGIPQVIQEEGRHGVGNLGGAAYIDPAQCQGCGTCTGECPANAIQLVNYTDNQIMLRDIAGLGSWLPENLLEAAL